MVFYPPVHSPDALHSQSWTTAGSLAPEASPHSQGWAWPQLGAWHLRHSPAGKAEDQREAGLSNWDLSQSPDVRVLSGHHAQSLPCKESDVYTSFSPWTFQALF